LLCLTLIAGVANAAEPGSAQVSTPSLAQALDRARQLLLQPAASRSVAKAGVSEGVHIAVTPQSISNALNSGFVGTWFVTVPGPGGFNAYQTFHSDGTFTETSSLLGKLPEGPAHGTWTGANGSGALTFELFAFDENGEMAGRIRVRNRLQLTGADTFLSYSVIDILPNGEEPILAVAEAEFTAQRQRLIRP
jgi:hypothetical protein